jgi:hypothetical protein
MKRFWPFLAWKECLFYGRNFGRRSNLCKLRVNSVYLKKSAIKRLFKTYRRNDRTDVGHSVNLGVDEVEKSLQETNTVRYYTIQDSGGVGDVRGGDEDHPCGITLKK